MKNIMTLIVICFSFLAFGNCSNFNSLPSNPNTIYYKTYETGNTIFYRPYSNEFYIVSSKYTMNLPINVEFVEFSQGILKITDVTNGNLIKFSYDQTSSFDVFEIGSFSGTDYMRLYLNTSGGFVQSDPQAVSCKCYKTGSNHTCDQGGPNSNSCSITDAGGVGTVNWEHSCSVSCNTGYYACCSNKLSVGDDGNGK